jgi:hypothetical protein
MWLGHVVSGGGASADRPEQGSRCMSLMPAAYSVSSSTLTGRNMKTYRRIRENKANICLIR